MSEPFLSVTGTIDGDVLGNGSTAGNRAGRVRRAARWQQYRVVFAEGDHAVFGGGDLRMPSGLTASRGKRTPRRPPQQPG